MELTIFKTNESDASSDEEVVDQTFDYGDDSDELNNNITNESDLFDIKFRNKASLMRNIVHK